MSPAPREHLHAAAALSTSAPEVVHATELLINANDIVLRLKQSPAACAA